MTSPSSAPSGQKASPLFLFGIFLSVCILILILAGGLVTSHEAGLAVPDWPLSYGQLMPPMVGNIFWEHGHRMIAGTVGILTLFFAFWIHIIETRNWVKKLGWTALAVVVLQAVLGGLTVKMLLPPPVSIFHACLAQTFFCLILSITYFLSPRFLSGVRYVQVITKPGLFFTTAGFVYLQLILGAALRHTHQYPAIHIINAFFVVMHLMLASGRIRNFYSQDPLLRICGSGLGWGGLLQLFLGFGSFIFKFVLERSYAPSTGAVIFTSMHQTLGAVLLGLSVLICLAVSRR